MKKAKIMNVTKDKVLVQNCMMADNFFGRLVGLMGKKILSTDEGMLISPCKSVHTFFMRFDVDIIFVDRNFEVVKIIKNVKPWKFSPYIKSARHIVEIASRVTNSELRSEKVEVGDKLNVIYKK